jgi:hypothetical protein
MTEPHTVISLKKSHALITIPDWEQGERDENLPDVRRPGGRDAPLVPPVRRAAARARERPRALARCGTRLSAGGGIPLSS